MALTPPGEESEVPVTHETRPHRRFMNNSVPYLFMSFAWKLRRCRARSFPLQAARTMPSLHQPDIDCVTLLLHLLIWELRRWRARSFPLQAALGKSPLHRRFIDSSVPLISLVCFENEVVRGPEAPRCRRLLACLHVIVASLITAPPLLFEN